MVLTIKLKIAWKWRIISVVVLGLLCLFTGADCKRSACWRYGHVCWGGHGKRSGQTSPAIPLADSVDEGDASYLPIKWALPVDQVRKNLAKERFQKQQLPNVVNLPDRHSSMRPDKEKYYLERSVPKLTLYGRLPASPTLMLRQNERHVGTGVDYNVDDALIVPDLMLPRIRETRMDAVLPASNLKSASLKSLRKRSHNDIQGTSPGTEEPLQASSNGLDSQNSGSIATFFRDRKLSLLSSKLADENISNERYLSPETGKIHMVAEIPVQDYRSQQHMTPGKLFY